MLLFRNLQMLVLAALVLTGCVAKDRNPKLEGLDVYQSGFFPEEAWAAAEEGEVLKDARATIVPIPFQLYSRSLYMTNKQAVVRHVDWNDIGIPLVLMLPVRIAMSEYEYQPGQSEPVASQKMHVNPLFATTKKRGGATPENLDANGIPLVYTTIKVESNNPERPWRVRSLNTLWSLGPANVDFRINGNGDGGYIFAPLLAGGIIGTTAWIDSELASHEDDGTVRARQGMHGPLYGALGLLHSKGEPEKNEAGEMTHKNNVLLLCGLLWQSRTEVTEENLIQDASHGPLWGMLGWGRRDYHDTINVAWIPVKIN